MGGLLGAASRYDLVVVLTWDAHLKRIERGDDWQARLVTALLEEGRPLIVAALKSPTDLLEFPQAPTFLATYGTTGGQLDALVEVLVGKMAPVGEDPLPGLIP